MNIHKKTIILAMTPDMEIFKCIVDNLLFLNYNVILICNCTPFSGYRNFYDRIKSNYAKKILKDKTYKEKLFLEYNKKDNLKTLDLINKKADYSLTIRADFFDKEVINKIISKSEQSYSYHWDGLLRHPKIYDLIPFFKKFYIFDKEDVAEKKTFLITNFYLDCYEDLFEDPILEYDVYFVGSNDSRIERLITICNYLKSKKLKLKIILYGEIQEWLKKYDYLTFIREPMSYLDNLKMISKSKILLDINHLHLHSGLSFRIFESLGYNKKLLTTNDLVMKYDFYNGNNIFVIDNNLEKIDSFLDNKIIHIKSSIKNKYSFTNWIKNVLEIKNNSI